MLLAAALRLDRVLPSLASWKLRSPIQLRS
jgi:hypothetical protein